MMDTRDTLTPEEFFKELRLNPKQRYAFVLGHGINYYLRNNVTSWKELLDKFIKGNLEELSFISQEKDIANTETANLIEFFADEEIKSGKPAAKMRDKLMCYLDERLNNDGPDQCALLDAAWEKHHILTTNFDDNIEKYLTRSQKICLELRVLKPGTHDVSRSTCYLWNRYWGCENNAAISQDSQDLHNDIWHIHGKLGDKLSRSVLFSLTRYVNAIKQVELWDLASKANWPGRNTWVNIFYNSPLIVAGLGLTNQEVFLRTLLIERKRHLKKQGRTDIRDYYLVRKHSKSTKESDGREFLRALGFKVVEFDDTEDMYNNANWRVNSK